ncbi:hypothetical protein TcCL_ESM03386 [Trypanosoma cruzi]|nr:hypothetical protein TcCL_ESM03386 [Trypanosoma cruzi]
MARNLHAPGAVAPFHSFWMDPWTMTMDGLCRQIAWVRGVRGSTVQKRKGTAEEGWKFLLSRVPQNVGLHVGARGDGESAQLSLHLSVCAHTNVTSTSLFLFLSCWH